MTKANKLAEEIAKRRGYQYPAHKFIAEHFPDYMEALLDLDHIIRGKERKFEPSMRRTV